jgi:hypothetical protein
MEDMKYLVPGGIAVLGKQEQYLKEAEDYALLRRALEEQRTDSSGEELVQSSQCSAAEHQPNRANFKPEHK